MQQNISRQLPKNSIEKETINEKQTPLIEELKSFCSNRGIKKNHIIKK